MPPECDACNVSNRVIRVNIVQIGRIRIRETMEGTNNKIKGRKGRTSTVKVRIEVFHLDNTSRMRARRSIITHAGDGMLRVSVSRMVRMWVVISAEVGMPRRIVGNRIVVETG